MGKEKRFKEERRDGNVFYVNVNQTSHTHGYYVARVLKIPSSRCKLEAKRLPEAPWLWYRHKAILNASGFEKDFRFYKEWIKETPVFYSLRTKSLDASASAACAWPMLAMI